MEIDAGPLDPSPDLVLIDGRDALAAVHIVRQPDPLTGEKRLAVRTHANGLGKLQAAFVLRQVARHWEAEEHAARVAAGTADDDDEAGA